MDHSLLHALNGFFFHHDGVEDLGTAYANAAEILFLGALIVAFVVARGHARFGARRAVAAAGLSAGLGLAVAQVISRLVDRDRPFVADPSNVHLFAHHAADPGFPSDHTTAAFAIAVAILLRNRRWGIPVLIAATALGLARIAMGVHYPSDVLGGAVLGTLAALTLWAPPVRRLLHAVADWFGQIVDRVVAALGMPQRAGLPPSARSR